MIRASRQTGVLGLFVILLGVSLQAQDNVPAELAADLIIYNAKIVTMSDASLNDSPGRIVEAMAVRGDLIQLIGSNQEVLRLAGPQTRKMDLKGRTVVPGLMNTHTHLHNSAVNAYFAKHPEKIERLARRFNVAGRTFAALTKGVELVIKEHKTNILP